MQCAGCKKGDKESESGKDWFGSKSVFCWNERSVVVASLQLIFPFRWQKENHNASIAKTKVSMTDIWNHWPFIDDIIKPLEAWWEGDYVDSLETLLCICVPRLWKRQPLGNDPRGRIIDWSEIRSACGLWNHWNQAPSHVNMHLGLCNTI